MEQPIKKNKFSYFARSRLRLRSQEIWERDYLILCSSNTITQLEVYVHVHSFYFLAFVFLF